MQIIRFSAKGWRTRFDDGFDEVNVARIADAFAYIWARARPGATVYIGYDTRMAGPRFAGTAARAIAGRGLKAVVSEAPCPTPALGWTVSRDESAVGAIMITASGAPSEYGGISARGADGGPVSEEFYDAAARIVSSAPVDCRGEFTTADIVSPYLENLTTLVDGRAIAQRAPEIVVDAMHGSGRGYLASVLRRLGCRVHEIHGELLADFGGLQPTPVEPWTEVCEHAVRSFGCDAGFALDGDADRLGLVDGTGAFVTPHRMVPLVMQHLVEDRNEVGRVVDTYSSSAYVRRQAERLGCPFTAVPMGFSRVYREFIEDDVLIGADEFGGVCMPAHFKERDALITALLLVEMMCVREQSIAELVAELEEDLGTLHYIRRDMRLDAASIQAFRNILPGLYLPEVCGQRPVGVGHADGLVLRFGDDSWVQLRPSRTEALVRACAEARDVRRAERLAEEACEGALRALP